MNQSDCDRIKDYCAKATAGPWYHRQAGLSRSGVAYDWIADVPYGQPQSKIIIQRESTYGGTPDYAFIAQARTDLPAAIAEIERLKAELEAIRDTADSVVAARAKVELPPDSPLNAAVFCLAKAFRDIGRGLET